MKELSSAIVVLTGAAVFAFGLKFTNSETQLFVMTAGGVVALLGLFRWWKLTS
jgi:hypothetical protein